jgi:hypothetical protein
MSKCFNFCGAEKYGNFIAKLPDTAKIANMEMDDFLAKEKYFPCELILKPFREGFNKDSGIWHDYMYNEFAYFMVSEKLKNFLSANSTENDCISWISVNIQHDNIVKKYYIIMFNELPDVLDKINTTYVRNTNLLLVPCIALEKAEKYSVFPIRMTKCGIPSLLYTTEKVKKEIQKMGFSNLIFQKAKTSLNGMVLK